MGKRTVKKFEATINGVDWIAIAHKDVWPEAVRRLTMEIAEAYARQPEKIANRVYADRMGNGSEASGDGWKYRGRGLIQLTGKENYQKLAQDHGVDCVNNPDVLLDPELALTSACWFWKKYNINRYADNDDIHMVTKRINGGNNGILHRQHYLDSFKRLYKVLEADAVLL